MKLGILMVLAALLITPACGGGTQGPGATATPDASTSPGTKTDTTTDGDDTASAPAGEGEASPEIIMQVIKTELE
jgi:ABC-type glycerol-3-phosphate transport system substrate-binding protein